MQSTPDRTCSELPAPLPGAYESCTREQRYTKGEFSRVGDLAVDVNYNLLSQNLQEGGRGYGQRIVIVNDAMGALRAGSPDSTSVVVACGTGTAVGARHPDGRIWHSSFWQEVQGADELSLPALRAVYRADRTHCTHS